MPSLMVVRPRRTPDLDAWEPWVPGVGADVLVRLSAECGQRFEAISERTGAVLPLVGHPPAFDGSRGVVAEVCDEKNPHRFRVGFDVPVRWAPGRRTRWAMFAAAELLPLTEPTRGHAAGRRRVAQPPGTITASPSAAQPSHEIEGGDVSMAMTLQEAYADAMSRWQAERARAEAAEAELRERGKLPRERYLRAEKLAAQLQDRLSLREAEITRLRAALEVIRDMTGSPRARELARAALAPREASPEEDE